jgi:hypothetical protein
LPEVRRKVYFTQPPRDARLFLVQHTQTGKIDQNQMDVCKIFQVAVKLTTCVWNLPTPSINYKTRKNLSKLRFLV